MFGSKLDPIVNSAVETARLKGHLHVTIEHVFLELLKYAFITRILDRCGVDVDSLVSSLKFLLETTIKPNRIGFSYEPSKTSSLGNVLKNALSSAQRLDRKEPDLVDLLVAIYSEKSSYSFSLLQKQGVMKSDILEAVPNNPFYTSYTNKIKDTSILPKFTVDLTSLAKKNLLDPLIGRENEIKRIMQILTRRKKSNPILVGEPGVGKTAIVEGLAIKLINNDTPDILMNTSLFALDIGSLLSGTKYRGDFEKRLKSILNEVKKIRKAIIFIDEVHTIVGAGATSGSSVDLSNLIKPHLANGELKCIGATTYLEYRNYFDKDKALSRRFTKIDIKEPTRRESYNILLGLKDKYERHHSIKYSDSSLRAATYLAKKYLSDKFLPDSAIELIDEVGASFNVKNKKRKVVFKKDIGSVVSKIANIPNLNATTDEKKIFKALGDNLKLKIFGQDEAIEQLVQSVKISKAGLGSTTSPIGSFLFLGPTGVGKTELSKQLANSLGVYFARFDMSEYLEKHSLSRLIGAPPGYIGYDGGGQLTEIVKKHPYSVLLLDEIEKAHPDLLNVLLQVMDSASLTDNNASKVDFKNVILIMTSNLGSQDSSSLGFSKDNSDKINIAVSDFFSPEFINRLSSIIHFNSLDMDVMVHIVNKFIKDIQHKLKNKKIMLSVTVKAKNYLARKCYSKEFGARATDRIIRSEIKAPLVDEVLFGKLLNGGKVCIDIKDKKIFLKFYTDDSLVNL